MTVSCLVLWNGVCEREGFAEPRAGLPYQQLPLPVLRQFVQKTGVLGETLPNKTWWPPA